MIILIIQKWFTFYWATLHIAHNGRMFGL